MAVTVNGENALSTIEVSKKLGFSVSIAFLKECGASPLHETHIGCYWRTKDFPIICHAISKHLESISRGDR